MSGSPLEGRAKWLAGRRSRLQPGPLADEFSLPPGVRAASAAESLTLIGPASAVARLRDEFQKLERSPAGSRTEVAGWTLRVDDEVPPTLAQFEISLPWHAWGMVGYLFSDVAYGWEPSPLQFSRTGYISGVGENGERIRWPQPDICVEVEGDLLGDAPIEDEANDDRDPNRG